jgi:hypothetical protein
MTERDPGAIRLQDLEVERIEHGHGLHPDEGFVFSDKGAEARS